MTSMAPGRVARTYRRGSLTLLALLLSTSELAGQKNNQPPTAATTGPYISTSLTVALDGSPSSDPDGPSRKLQFAWSFGDGKSGTGAQVSHTYPAIGTYDVTVIVTDQKGASAAASTTVTIHGPPTAVAGGPYGGPEGSAVQMDGRGSSDPDGDALTYAWSFGDGSTGTGAQPVHAYGDNGTYTVTLRVTDSRGATSSASTATATITNVAPMVSASVSPATIPAGGTATLSGSFSDPGAADGPWSYTIDWGDGSTESSGSTSDPAAPIGGTHVYGSASTYTVALQVTDKDGGKGSAQQTVTVSPPVVAVILAAGDIADCTKTGDEATAALLDQYPEATVFTIGDNVYPDGTLDALEQCYGPNWGRHKSRTWPTVGNHEYTSTMPNAEGYHAYFGERAGEFGKAYYTLTMGEWQIFVLNSNIARGATSAQTTWLRSELAKGTKHCTLAMWHHPRFASGQFSSGDGSVGPFWDALYDADADLVLNGHFHFYERYAPQTPGGVADPVRGIRQITVGTGGESHVAFGTPIANSEVREYLTYGVLMLTLESDGYSWEFIPVQGASFRDSGRGSCH